MSKPFYEQQILNSPYFVPYRHHSLAEDGRPLDFPCVYRKPYPS
jgi:type III restriction enzyme